MPTESQFEDAFSAEEAVRVIEAQNNDAESPLGVDRSNRCSEIPDLREAVEHVEDITDCLWSYKTALSLASQMKNVPVAEQFTESSSASEPVLNSDDSTLPEAIQVAARKQQTGPSPSMLPPNFTKCEIYSNGVQRYPENLSDIPSKLPLKKLVMVTRHLHFFGLSKCSTYIVVFSSCLL